MFLLIPMIPYFLTLRTSAILNSRFYEPEYTYTTYVSTTNVDERTGLRLKAFDMISTLKCRPRTLKTLNCHFDNTGMKFYQQGLASLGEDSIKAWDINEEPFEVVFDENGVTDLVVTQSMPPWIIGGLRAIVNQLNLGVDLTNKPEGTFTAMEKSYLGKCQTVVRVSSQLTEDNAYETIEIVSTPRFKKAFEAIEIEKWRNLEECVDKVDYFFGSSNVSPITYGSTGTKMISSISRIYISASNYTSYTANEITVTNENTKKNVKLYEKVTLTLDSLRVEDVLRLKKRPLPIYLGDVDIPEDRKEEEDLFNPNGHLF